MFTDAVGREFTHVKGRHAIIAKDFNSMLSEGDEVVILEDRNMPLCIPVEHYVETETDAAFYRHGHIRDKAYYMLMEELRIKPDILALDVTTGKVIEIPVDSEPVNSEPQAQEPWQERYNPHSSLRTCRGIFWDDTTKERMTFEKGYFHQWGNCYEEFENGPGNYSVAIIELEDGRVIDAMPSDIHFTDIV